MLETVIAALGSGWFGVIILALIIAIVIAKPSIDWTNKSITFRQNKRSCKDCFEIIQAIRTGFELEYSLKLNSILRLQMVYAEQKLEDIIILTKKDMHPRIKDEIRRSFKENGFEEMQEDQYSRYLDDRYDILTTMINDDSPEIRNIIKQIYDHAKETKIKIDAELVTLQHDFIKRINETVGIK